MSQLLTAATCGDSPLLALSVHSVALRCFDHFRTEVRFEGKPLYSHVPPHASPSSQPRATAEQQQQQRCKQTHAPPLSAIYSPKAGSISPLNRRGITQSISAPFKAPRTMSEEEPQVRHWLLLPPLCHLHSLINVSSCRKSNPVPLCFPMALGPSLSPTPSSAPLTSPPHQPPRPR